GRRELLHELDAEGRPRSRRRVDDFPGQLYPLADKGREERVDSGQTVLRGERRSGGGRSTSAGRTFVLLLDVRDREPLFAVAVRIARGRADACHAARYG